jgi:putative restriction endonuclease
MVNLWVANTDLHWFDFLAARPGIDEVNFWQPSGAEKSTTMRPGELFLFRLKSPRNVIGGYGVFSHASNLAVSLAWEAFGEKNGASSLEEMRQRIGKYRGEASRPHEDFKIGCRIIVEPVFFPQHLWAPQPRSWAGPIQTSKKYDTSTQEGRELWERMHEIAALTAPRAGVRDEPARYGAPVLIAPRLGQGAFRISVTDAYGRACAVSGGKVLPALDAAHIRPYAQGGAHDVTNGILLRRDIHCLFDAGYVTVDEDRRFVVSERVKIDFDNGSEYRRLHGSALTLPAARGSWPDANALAWHNETVFRG